MFNKDLFLSLCKKYGVEISKTATTPMIKEELQIREITTNDVNRIFTSYNTKK